MLILYEHRFHVSLKFIDFCIKNQIVAFCLSPYITHILKPLDIRIFVTFS